MTIYECWIKGCKENGSLLYNLSTRCDIPESGFFKVTREYMVNGNSFYEPPVYFVWYRGKEKYNGLNYQEALNAWERCNAEEK